MVEGPESPNNPNKLVLPENVSIIALYTFIMGKMNPQVAKLVNLAQIWTCTPLKAHNSPKGYVRGPRIFQNPP